LASSTAARSTTLIPQQSTRITTAALRFRAQQQSAARGMATVDPSKRPFAQGGALAQHTEKKQWKDLSTSEKGKCFTLLY
jgi:hypothetical protein